jgi:hypothetical protein
MRRKGSALALVAGALLIVGEASPALAHEEREVGRYHFAVGFGSEPAYASEQNSVQLLLHDANGKPVTALEPGLKVSVSFGSQTASFPIEPNFEVGEFGIPGDYRAWFIPTRSGRYSFHFTGKLNGQPVDATFASGPKTFDDVADATSVEFPVQDPTVGQLTSGSGASCRGSTLDRRRADDRVERLRRCQLCDDVLDRRVCGRDRCPRGRHRIDGSGAPDDVMLAHATTPDETVGELLFAAAGALGWVAFWRLRGNGFLRLSRLAGWAIAMLAVAAAVSGVVVPSLLAPSYATVRPRSTATIRFVEPTRNEVVSGGVLQVDIRLTGGRLTSLTTTTLTPDTGHLHLSIDGRLLSMTVAERNRVDISGLPDGEHLLQAEFVAADHGPFAPPVIVSTPFRKEG